MTGVAWGFLAVAVFLAVLLAIVLGATDEIRRENADLRRRIHPSTRNRGAHR